MNTFTKLVNQLDYSMLVVTAAANDERAGCLIGFASQVSIHPPRFLVCPYRLDDPRVRERQAEPHEYPRPEA